MDMSETIVINSDQINAEDFGSGPRTFTITEVRPGSSEQPVWIFFAEVDGKSFRPALTVRKLLILCYGADTDNYIGKRITLYNDESVKWGGKAIGGVRISHASGLAKPVVALLQVTRGKRELHRIEPLPDAPVQQQRPATVAEQAKAAVGWWAGKGVREDQLVRWVGLQVGGWDHAVLARLRGLAGAVDRGEATVTEVFGTPDQAARPARPGPPHLDPNDGREPTDAEQAEAFEREQAER